jgi:hypothetical protein
VYEHALYPQGFRSIPSGSDGEQYREWIKKKCTTS